MKLDLRRRCTSSGRGRGLRGRACIRRRRIRLMQSWRRRFGRSRIFTRQRGEGIADWGDPYEGGFTRRIEGGREWRGGAGSHGDLCGVWRADGRHRRILRRFGSAATCRGDGSVLSSAGIGGPSRDGEGNAARGRSRDGGGGCGAARADHAESYGNALVHAALRNILGTHVKQAGSLNAPERLRFDFSHFAPVGQEELKDIEQQVNEEIRLNTQIETGVMYSGGSAEFGCAGVLRGQISGEQCARGDDSRSTRAARLLFEGIVRRNARATHRRYRRAENCERGVRGGGRTAD